MTRSSRVKPKVTPSVDVVRLATEIAQRLRALPVRNTPNVRTLRREYSRRLVRWPADAVLEVAFRVFETPQIEHRFLAYELVCHHRDAMRTVRAKELEIFGNGLDSWGAVDIFACYLAGPAWRERQVPDAWIHRWARSPDRWRRRAAVVATVALNNKARGGRGDTARTLDVCRRLSGDRDDMVAKALSWALRELAKRDPAAVTTFLEEHRYVVAARVLREVNNKLRTGLKNPRN